MGLTVPNMIFGAFGMAMLVYCLVLLFFGPKLSRFVILNVVVGVLFGYYVGGLWYWALLGAVFGHLAGMLTYFVVSRFKQESFA
ncbi:hypothetical protein COT97_05755 [Candidatus Falkowbacteria bacterium CG10_big_fil_rev_8_21_14_0_10_39_11]|uniref:Uncharacterized protein n=1 Tax=Candidatus Falkowbacteria bacterium CG10_big_fil_rev_8_21_14_0_10_39_11 TaxID=1974565 RepID=A0A2H0V3G8_9BACT|nr:MAG: hypothetical protein COT97_05755 [Candidatus Falkowbacteria bacterium CG10_big_fil_rev_8_21_14_0_10_39_11]